jgi:hypothetical protein
MIKPLAIAMLSWMFSLLVGEAYEYQTWQCLVNMSLVDFMFFAVFYYSDIDNQKVRWICTLLFISIVFTWLSSVAFFLYHYKLIGASFFAVDVDIDLFGNVSLVLSLLILIVSSLNDRVMDRLDGLCWPSFAHSFRYSFDLSRIRNAKKGAF